MTAQIIENVPLFDGIWILEKKSGICLFSIVVENNSVIEISDEILCGFFSAISTIANHTFTEEISYIDTTSRRICFRNSSKFSFVFSIDYKRQRRSRIESIINLIIDEFVNLFEKDFERWDRDISSFESFLPRLKNLFSKKKESLLCIEHQSIKNHLEYN